MPQILIVEKEGNIKSKKKETNTIDDLYKSCGFRKNDNFDKINTIEKVIDNENIIVELWGRKIGKNNIKNNYKFPESLNIPILYGNCCLIRIDNNIIDLDETMWNKIGNINTETTPMDIDCKKNDDIDDGLDNGLDNEIENKIENEIVNEIENDVNNVLTLSDETEKDKKDDEDGNNGDNNGDNDDSSSFSSDSSDDYGSELKEESYVYSSEEEDN